MKTREITLMFKSPCKLQKNKLHSFKSEKKKKNRKIMVSLSMNFSKKLKSNEWNGGFKVFML